ncbi:hypothetical protein DSECCO2_369060 [anaerobic digester metagenome]
MLRLLSQGFFLVKVQFQGWLHLIGRFIFNPEGKIIGFRCLGQWSLIRRVDGGEFHRFGKWVFRQRSPVIMHSQIIQIDRCGNFGAVDRILCVDFEVVEIIEVFNAKVGQFRV